MNYNISKMLKGQFEYDYGTLAFSVQRLELTVGLKGSLTGSFIVTGPQNVETEVFLFVSGTRMSIGPDHFILEAEEDRNAAEVQYAFDATGLSEGDVTKGNIHVVSSRGEYCIPYVVTVSRNEMVTTVGNIRNLFHFANLAKVNWLEAMNVFYSPSFPSVLTGNDQQFLSLYRGLTGVNSFQDGTNEQNMEEFLIAINKKSGVEFSFEEEGCEYSGVMETIRGTIRVNRNGWGYTHLDVTCDGEFLSTERSVLTDLEFLGNLHTLRYFVDPSKLHGGNNLGRIILSNPYTTLVYTVMVHQQYESSEYRKGRERRQLLFELVDLFVRFRSKLLSLADWVAGSEKLIDAMLEIDSEDTVALMYRTQLLLTQERTNEAKWLLGRIDDLYKRGDIAMSDSEKAYFYYLTTLSNRDEEYVNQVSLEVEHLLRRNPGDWRICWFLLYLKEEYARNDEKRLLAVKNQFHLGCNSPIMLIEAYNVFLNNPLLMTELDEFTVHVLLFACRRNILRDDLIDQILYLTGREKQYNQRIAFILMHCYEMIETDQVLSVLVAYLITGDCIDSRAFKWYEKGILHNVRVTNLYEYYMMSISPDYLGEIPRMVLMYFSYHCDLPFERKALLYAYLEQHAEEYSEIERGAEEEIQQFLLSEIRKGHINRDLAYLYKNKLDLSLLDTETAAAFVPLIFMHVVTVENPNVKAVVLVQDKFAREYVYRLEGGRAMFPIYSAEYRILLQDGNGNRYADTIPINLEKLLLPGKHCKAVAPLVKDSVGLNVYLCEESRNYVEINEGNVERFLYLMNSQQISSSYKSTVRSKLAEYYYRTDRIEPLDRFLSELRPEGMDFKERAEFIQYMTDRGMFDKAYEWVCIYGPEEVNEKCLMHLVSHLIVRSNYAYEEMLLRMAEFSYNRGKFDEHIIKYLVAYYNTGIRELKKLLRAAHNCYVDPTYVLEGMLRQMMFSGAFTGDGALVFEEYKKRPNPDSDITDAFLAMNAFQYFVKDELIDPILIGEMRDCISREHDLPEPCKFAILKYYDENREELIKEYHPIIKNLIGYCQRKRFIFPFLTNYADIFPSMVRGNEKTYIEYKTNPAHRVYIHYLIEQDGEKRGEYKTEEMTMVYTGIYVKDVILFFGESLQYYIAEVSEGEEQLVESGSLRSEEMVQEENHTVFGQINDVSIGLALQDYNAALECTDEYLRQKYLVRNLFHTI